METWERGQKDSNLRASYRLWFSRPAHSSALPCPLRRLAWLDYTISWQNIYVGDGRAPSGWYTLLVYRGRER